MMFGYTCQNYVLIAYKELKFRSKRRMTKVSARHILLCASLYLFVGIFGYLTFPDSKSKDNLLIQYDPVKRIPFMIALATMIISTLTALPFILRPCEGSILIILYPKDRKKRESKTARYTTILSLYALLVVITFACIQLNFNLTQVLTMISTFTSPLVSFKIKKKGLILLDVLQLPVLLQCFHHGQTREGSIQKRILLVRSAWITFLYLLDSFKLQ
jgi:amino acid permease